MGKPRGEIFRQQGTAPPPALPAAVPAAPSPPPNPYRFAGSARHGESTQVFLANADRVLEVHEGAELDGGYRVEAISQDQITLVYLPFGTRSIVAVDSILEIASALPAVAAATPAMAGAAADPAHSPGRRGEHPPRLRWEGPGEVRAGASFNVALVVAYDGALRASPMQLRFDTKVLEALDVRPGKFFGRGPFSYRVNADGSIFVGASGAGAVPGAQGELVILTFKPIKPGAVAEVHVASLGLQSTTGGSVQHERPDSFRATIIQ
jgi:hypothetical protein